MPGVKEEDVDPRQHDHQQRTSGQALGMVLLVSGTLALLTVATDQATKALMTRWIGPSSSDHRYDLLGTVLGFEFVRNTGVAFGLLQGRQWLVSILAIVVLAGFLLAFWRELPSHRLLQVGVGLIVGGSVGNLVDRFRLGYVVDFIAVGEFPRFNIADSAITVGLVFLCAFLVFEPGHHEEPDRSVNRMSPE